MSIVNPAFKGSGIFYLNTSKLEKGVYIFEIESNSQTWVQRFLISR